MSLDAQLIPDLRLQCETHLLSCAAALLCSQFLRQVQLYMSGCTHEFKLCNEQQGFNILCIHPFHDNNSDVGALQIGQVMLTIPTSYAQLGLASALCIQIWVATAGAWTSYLLNVLYMDYRKRMQAQGYKRSSHVLQVLHCERNVLLLHVMWKMGHALRHYIQLPDSW